MRDNLLECCGKRGDIWASEVQNRLHGCIDLVAAEAGASLSMYKNLYIHLKTCLVHHIWKILMRMKKLMFRILAQ